MRMQRPRPSDFRRLAVLLLAAVATACGGGAEYQKEPTSLEPRDTYALQVESEIVSLDVVGNGQGQPLPVEALRLAKLVDEFAVNGNGPLVVSTPPGHGAGGSRLAIAIADQARGRGLAKGEVVVNEVAEATGAVNVSFERVFVRLPDCRGWGIEPTYNPSNSPHINFGCATQRNLGMMVANPADLIGPSAEGGVQETSRMATVFRLYRLGEIFVSDLPKDLESQASGIAQ